MTPPRASTTPEPVRQIQTQPLSRAQVQRDGAWPLPVDDLGARDEIAHRLGGSRGVGHQTLERTRGAELDGVDEAHSAG